MSDANRQPGAYIIDENTFEMLYNNESVRFWKYNSIPDEAEQLKWNEHDIITFAIDRYTYEYKHEEIKQIKSKFALTVTVLPDDIVINNDTINSIDIEAICKSSIPDKYKNLFEEITTYMKATNEIDN